MGRVEGKVVIVTGAARGIGRADALLLAREGATVVATDVIEDEDGVLAERGIKLVSQDERDESAWEALVSDTIAQHGCLDVLVNNAGVIHVGDPVTFDMDEWRHMSAVNIEGMMLGCKHALLAMIETGSGSIINMSSVAARSGLYFYSGYCASKGAIAAYSKSVAVYCAQNKLGIRCNTILPGGIETPLVEYLAVELDQRGSSMRLPPQSPVSPDGPTMRFGEPDDIAYMVVYLASEESKFMSGSEIYIDNTATITAASVE